MKAKRKLERKDYLIIPNEATKGIFKVINLNNAMTYKVDIKKPFCSCECFKFGKKDRKGNKKVCGHIKICRGIS